MLIYIPSLNRAKKQVTLNALRDVRGVRPVVVVEKEEVKEYKEHNPGIEMLSLPKGLRGIGHVRQWLVKHHAKNEDDPRMVMLDDDLEFATRDAGGMHATVSTEQEKSEMFKALHTGLGKYAFGSVLPREGANRVAGHDVIFNTRLIRVLGVNVETFNEAKARFDRLEVMEDFDATLQLLRAGYANFVLCNWWQNQRGSGLSGGCSTYRDMEMQARGAKMLHEKHPDFVKIVQKETKSAWGGGIRTDVMVQWKKAFLSSGAQT